MQSCAVVAEEEIEVIPLPEPPTVNWDISKSKKATNLDKNFESQVTLSLPAAEEQIEFDVMFVLDKSESTAKSEISQAVEKLLGQIEDSKGIVNIGVVTFNKEIPNKLPLTELTPENLATIQEAIEYTNSTGTNIHAGLLEGMKLLDQGSAAQDKKYLILVSDGITYLYNDENGVGPKTINNHGQSSPDDYEGKYGTTAAPSDWETYLNDINTLVTADGTTYEGTYISRNEIVGAEKGLYGGGGYGNDPLEDHAMSVDKALLRAYEAYTEAMGKYGKNHVYAIGRENASYPWAGSFMNYLASISANEQDIEEIVTHDIYYLLDAGSFVKDYMGYVENDYDFDFVNKASAMTLTVGGESYAAVELGSNQYGFKPIEGTNGYAYKVTYEKGNGKDEEHFVWDINEAVTNFASVQLTYTVKLTNPKTEAGTYTDLETNNCATLHPVDSNGDPGDSEDFEKPTVSYTVADTTTPARPDKWEKSKSKTATNLDSNYQSAVTLSLPSAEEELVSDIVFVLDKSSCNDAVAAQATELLNGLLESIEKTDAKIKVGIVTFRNRGVERYSLQEISKDDIANISEIITTKPDGSGTNIDGGLLEAQKMLENDTAVLDSRKHIILVTDGLARLFSYGADNKTGVILHEMSADSPILAGEYTGWCLANGFGDGEYAVPWGNWSTYFSNISGKVETDKDNFVFDFENDLQMSAWIENKHELFTELKDSGKVISNTEISQHALAVDRAIYDAYETYVELENQYNCYAVNVAPTALGTALTEAMNTYSDNSINNSSDMAKAFDSIQNDIYYLLDAGSRVEDYMGYVDGENGYDFDFVNDTSAMTMKVGDTSYEAVELEENKYSFNDGAYIVEYFPGEKGNEHFVWTMNVPVSNFAPVQLTYTVKLTNPQTIAGTYGEYDADGSHEKGGLYTNNSATLYPVDSNETAGEPEDFAKPTVSYTVKTPDVPVIPGNDGNGSGGTTDTLMTVQKVWAGDNSTTRPSSITVILTSNGSDKPTTVTLNEANDWTYQWKTSVSGWNVKEENVPAGYKVSYSRAENTFTITNTYAPDEVVPDTDVPTTDPSAPSVDVAEPDVPATEVPGTPVSPTEVSEEVSEPEASLGDAPKTGDAAPTVALVSLMAAAAVGLAITRRKFN